eukprot:754308-Hanusia_phi.AAC.1
MYDPVLTLVERSHTNWTNFFVKGVAKLMPRSSTFCILTVPPSPRRSSRKNLLRSITYGHGSAAQLFPYRLGLQVQDPKCIFLWGFKIAFGGQKSTGFGVIYDNLNAAKKSLSKHLLLREGIIQKQAGKLARKAGKERKNKVKKVRGKEKAEVRTGKAVAKKKKE